jgi:hypothetical protein
MMDLDLSPENVMDAPKAPKGLKVLIWPVVIALVVGMALGAVVPRVLHRAAPLSAAQASAYAGAVNLTLNELPPGWISVPANAAPISGYIGSGSSSALTPQEKVQNSAVIARFQACIGLSNATDRTFGAAGVQPIAQVPSSSFLAAPTASAFEAGTATQYYTDSSNVSKDQAQMAIPGYAVCLDQAIGRMSMIGAVSDPAATIIPAHEVTITQSHGAFIRSAQAQLTFPGNGASSKVWLGLTLIIEGHIEQSFYTLGPRQFPATETQQIVNQLAKKIQEGPSSSLA